jgi:ATP-dependent Lon protease
MTKKGDFEESEQLREAVADRIVRADDYKRNPNGRVLIPERAFKHDPDETRFGLMMSDENDLVEPDDNSLSAEVMRELMSSKDERDSNPAAHKVSKPFRRCVRIFQPDDLESLRKIASSSFGEVKRRIESGLKLAGEHEGYRQLPNFRSVSKKLDGIYKKFENFKEVIEHLSGELMLTAVSKPDAFRVRPILLDGPPGVGKTAFAQRVATELGLPFLKISAGGLQHAFVFTGSASHWGNSQTGEIFNLIGRNKSASAVILIDEVDKISNRSEYAILPALLDLLEPVSSARYREESLGLTFDASRLIVLLTSNRKYEIDAALLSRCSVFDIENPGVDQRVLIAVSEFDEFNSKLSRANRKELDFPAVVKLAKTNIDVRTLVHAVKSGVVKAVANGERAVRPIPASQVVKTHRIGFV